MFVHFWASNVFHFTGLCQCLSRRAMQLRCMQGLKTADKRISVQIKTEALNLICKTWIYSICLQVSFQPLIWWRSTQISATRQRARKRYKMPYPSWHPVLWKREETKRIYRLSQQRLKRIQTEDFAKKKESTFYFLCGWKESKSYLEKIILFSNCGWDARHTNKTDYFLLTKRLNRISEYCKTTKYFDTWNVIRKIETYLQLHF